MPETNSSRGKPELRREVGLKLENFPLTQYARASKVIRRHFISSAFVTTARVILLFAAFRREPDLTPLIAEFGDRHRFCLPRVSAENRGGLEVLEVRNVERELVSGTFGIREPHAELCAPIEIASIDVAAIPGVAFTSEGARLGRGGGYYDRLLSHPEWSACSIGVALSCQLVPYLPIEPHDRSVDHLLTENGWVC